MSNKRRQNKTRQRSQGKCGYCGCEFDGNDMATVDHIIPRAHGGCDHDHNKMRSCTKCNMEKADKMPNPEFEGSYKSGKLRVLYKQAYKCCKKKMDKMKKYGN